LMVSNIIGTGITPLSQAPKELLVPDPRTGESVPFRKIIGELFLAWTDESDADGVLDFYGQQSQAARCWLEAGEVFVRLRPRFLSDGLTVPLQVQVIEPEMCPHTYDTTLESGNLVRAGIEFDAIGKRVAYWFYQSRPGDLMVGDYLNLRRVPAESVRHIYIPERAGQLRGVPWLTQALNRLFNLDKYDDATLLRQQLANMFVGFVTRPATLGDVEATNPLTGLGLNEDAEGHDLVPLEPGLFQELNPGEGVTFSDPPKVQGYAEYTKQQLQHACVAAGIPYELVTGDMTGVNDRTVRVILQEFRRGIQALQHQIIAFQFCRPLYTAWLDRVFVSGALEIPSDYTSQPEPWRRVKWQPQAWAYIQPVQDVEAMKDAVRAGFTTRSAVVSEQGEDAATIDEEQKADNDRADALGLPYESDARVALKASSSPGQEIVAQELKRGA